MATPRTSRIPPPMTLRTFAKVSALAGCIFANLLRAQTTVTTDPVGFTSVTIPAGAVRAVSLPLNNFADCTAAVSGVTPTTISTTNAGWTTNAFGPFSSKPHVIRFLSGAYQGRQFAIASNTSDTLTLTTDGVDLTAPSALGNQYSIFPVSTLQSLFGATAPSLKRSVDSTQADNILVRDSSGWVTYYNDGTQWLHEGGATIDNATALLPEAGFLFVRRGNTAYDFSATGAVPLTKLVTELPADKTLFFANRFPVSTTLMDLGLAQSAGWNAGSNAGSADNVLIRGSFGWLTYYFDGTNWRRAGPGSVDNATIPVGGALLVVRRAGSDTTLDEPKPY